MERHGDGTCMPIAVRHIVSSVVMLAPSLRKAAIRMALTTSGSQQKHNRDYNELGESVYHAERGRLARTVAQQNPEGDHELVEAHHAATDVGLQRIRTR